MSLHPGNIFFGNGATQRSRINEAFAPDFVRIDERSEADLLAFAAAYARLVRFYNLDNEPDGSWERFFLNDISVLLALITHTNTAETEQQFNLLTDKLLRQNNLAEKKRLFRELLHLIAGMIFQINDWYVRSTQLLSPEKGLEHDVAGELYNVITRKLSPHFQSFRQHCLATEKAFGIPVGIRFDHLNKVWESETEVVPSLDGIIGDSASAAHQINQAAIKLRNGYRVFHDTTASIAFQFQRYFERSLSRKQNHSPNMGLYIAFLQLYRFAQNAINEFPGKFLNLYYQKMLRQEKRPNLSDQVHVCFELASNLESALIPKGSELSAGVFEDGSEIIYTTENDLEVNRAQVDSVKTVFLSKGVRETVSNFELVSNIYVAPFANSKDGKGTPFDMPHQSWPTFGEEQFEKLEETHNMKQGEVGFAIASPVLLLREGKRSVDMTLHFDPSTTRIYEKLIRDVMEKSGEPSLEEAFYKVFNPQGKKRNLSIYASGPRGWISVDPQKVKFQLPEMRWTPDSFTISFQLDVTDPPLQAYDPAIFPDAYFASDYPLVKVVTNSEREPFAYSFLKNLRLSAVDIQVAVDKVRKCQLYNDIGQIDGTQPFQPFGPVPAHGSYLLAGSSEIFRKKLDALSIRMDWQDLPKTELAFQTYFKDYNLSAYDFKVRLKALSRSEFGPAAYDPDLEFPLFTEDDNKELYTCFDLGKEALAKLNPGIAAELPVLNPYDNDTQTGYFKIELSAPEEAFGHAAYQKVITRSMAQNAKVISEAVSSDSHVNTDSLEIPNPPLTPTARALVFSYKASARLVMDDDAPEYPQQLFHVHPFGSDKIYPFVRSASSAARLLMPQYEDDGYLYISLKNAKPQQVVTLFFQMTVARHKELSVHSVPDVHWAYLSRNNEWKVLNDQDLLTDSTDKFTRSGIIKLRLPADISLRSTLLPGGSFWIRASVSGDVDALCHTIDVRTQAVLTRWKDNGNPDHLRKPLMPGAIVKLRERRGEIKSVAQPFESFGGKAMENDPEFFTRISERLRHKHRAVTHWEFERLVLEHFPSIFQVKCLSYLSHPVLDKKTPETDATDKGLKMEDAGEVKVAGIRKGEGIQLVVAPRRSRYLKEQTPSVNFKVLQAVEDFLKDYTSPFVQIKVRNPGYEYVRIYCKVKFQEKGNDGYWIGRLKEDIRNFICPWVNDFDAYVEIGGHVSVDAVKNHVRSLPYVRFVTAFSILHIIVEDLDNQIYHIADTADPKHSQVVYASKPWSVIITDEDHEFEVIEEEMEELPQPVKPPVRFQSEYDILKRYRYIRIIERKFEHIKVKDNKTEQTEFSIHIKI